MIRMLAGVVVVALSFLAWTASALAAGLNVEVMVVERDGEQRSGEPVTGGVPLPEGAFKDVANLRLVDPDGKEVPCQMTPTVRWWRDQSVRWVLLDFQATVPGFSMRPLFLRDDGPAKPIENPIAVQEDENRITVSTGPLRFAVRKKGFNLIDEAWLDESGQGVFDDAHRIVAPGNSGGPALWSNSPNLPAYRGYFAARDTNDTVTVEENGPMRVVIKAIGRHLPDKPEGADDKLLDYTLRLHAYRGQSFVRVVYSAECKQGKAINNFVPVDRWHVTVPGQLGTNLTYTFGGESAAVEGTFGEQDRAWQVCESADRYEVGGAALHHAKSGALEGHPKSTRPWRFGYMDLSGSDRGIMLSMRWMWQNYPKGFFAQSDGSVHAALWPAFVRKTGMVSTGPRAHFFPGVSKTHELLVYLHGPKGKDRFIELNCFLQRPLVARCRPEWYCEKTRAFGKVASSNPALYPEDKRWVVEAYDYYFEQDRRAILDARDFVRDTDAYGMFNFGDTINHITPGRRGNAGERPDPTDIHWDNNYYDYPHGLIIQSVRTGNLDLMELAEQASTHLQDVDIHCWHPDPRFIGAPRYSAGPDHIRNYGNGDPVYSSDTYNHYKNLCLFERYWLFGDRRALDIALLSAGFARTHKTDAISQSRSIGHGIVGLLAAYQTTLDTSYLDAAKTIVEKTRGFRKSDSGAWIDGIAHEGHRAWYEVTGDTKAIETVLGGVDAALAKKDLAGAILHAFGFAYGQTGDTKYLDNGVKGLLRNARGRNTTSISFGNAFRSTGYFFWYLTTDLPKKEEVPVLKW